MTVVGRIRSLRVRSNAMLKVTLTLASLKIVLLVAVALLILFRICTKLLLVAFLWSKVRVKKLVMVNRLLFTKGSLRNLLTRLVRPSLASITSINTTSRLRLPLNVVLLLPLIKVRLLWKLYWVRTRKRTLLIRRNLRCIPLKIRRLRMNELLVTNLRVRSRILPNSKLVRDYRRATIANQKRGRCTRDNFPPHES